MLPQRFQRTDRAGCVTLIYHQHVYLKQNKNAFSLPPYNIWSQCFLPQICHIFYAERKQPTERKKAFFLSLFYESQIYEVHH